MDFCSIEMRKQKNGVYVFYPDFLVFRSNDLMIRGKSFYAVYCLFICLFSEKLFAIIGAFTFFGVLRAGWFVFRTSIFVPRAF